MAAQPEFFYAAHPDVVSAAIKALVAAIMVIGGTLISVIVYIWQSHKKEWREAVTGIKVEIEKLSNSLETIADKLFSKTDLHEHRITEIETSNRTWQKVCDERHKQIVRDLLQRKE